MHLIFIGAPGAGKGTQADRVSEHFGITHLSTGDMLREEIRNHTDAGKQIEEIMANGALVPDEIIFSLLKERFSAPNNGYLLDGFPRNPAQAESLWSIAPDIDAVVELHAQDNIIVKRISGRLNCPSCGDTFHETDRKPKVDGVCDTCGEKLIKRPDDNAQTVMKRLEIYYKMTEPLIDYYRHKNMLITVDGVGDVENITQSIIAAVGEKIYGHTH